MANSVDPDQTAPKDILQFLSGNDLKTGSMSQMLKLTPMGSATKTVSPIHSWGGGGGGHNKKNGSKAKQPQKNAIIQKKIIIIKKVSDKKTRGPEGPEALT